MADPSERAPVALWPARSDVWVGREEDSEVPACSESIPRLRHAVTARARALKSPLASARVCVRMRVRARHRLGVAWSSSARNLPPHAHGPVGAAHFYATRRPPRAHGPTPAHPHARPDRHSRPTSPNTPAQTIAEPILHQPFPDSGGERRGGLRSGAGMREGTGAGGREGTGRGAGDAPRDAQETVGNQCPLIRWRGSQRKTTRRAGNGGGDDARTGCGGGDARTAVKGRARGAAAGEARLGGGGGAGARGQRALQGASAPGPVPDRVGGVGTSGRCSGSGSSWSKSRSGSPTCGPLSPPPAPAGQARAAAGGRPRRGSARPRLGHWSGLSRDRGSRVAVDPGLGAREGAWDITALVLHYACPVSHCVPRAPLGMSRIPLRPSCPVSLYIPGYVPYPIAALVLHKSITRRGRGPPPPPAAAVGGGDAAAAGRT